MYLQVKNEQIKMILVNHGKLELSDGLSTFHSPYEELIFRLRTLPADLFGSTWANPTPATAWREH